MHGAWTHTLYTQISSLLTHDTLVLYVLLQSWQKAKYVDLKCNNIPKILMIEWRSWDVMIIK